MPLLVRVETETGAVVEKASDVHDALTSLAERAEGQGLALAHTIDPWGNTVFNRLQIPMLLRDIETLGSMASADERKTLDIVVALAKRTLEEPHLYLKLYGD